MKIVYISDDFPPESFGGAGIIASRLAHSFAQKGNEVVVLTVAGKKESAGESMDGNVRVIKLYSSYHVRWRNYRSVWNPFLIFRVSKILKEIKPDIVHCHNIHLHYSFAVLKIAKRYAKSVFFTAHDSQTVSAGKVYPIDGRTDYKISWLQELKQAGLRFNPFRRLCIKYYLGFVDSIFSVSDSLKKNLEANGIKNVLVLHNGISASEWHVPLIPPTEVSFECGDLSGKKIILYAGRLSGGKGANEILTALQKVLNSVPNAYLLVLGKRDGYAEKMMERIEKLGIGRSVGFTGWVSGDKLKHAYRISDVVVVPSVYLDPFPTVNLEAMASGKPVVGSCFGGTPEVVEDGKTGYVVNPLDIETFSDKITALLLNERMAKEMGDNGRECVEKSFSLDTQVEKLLALYNKNLEI